MARCDQCGTTILFGGVRVGDLRFCSAKCLGNNAVVRVMHEVPEDVLDERVTGVHEGACPRCGGPGPVDVHTSHTVWSLVLITSWRSRKHVCCGRCALKSQILDLVGCFLLGWWGIPLGLIVTPIQIGLNVAALLKRPDPSEPSDALRRLLRLQLARAIAQSRGPAAVR